MAERKSKKRWLSGLIKGVSYFTLVLVIAVVGIFLWLRSSLPQLNGSITVSGISAPINIIRDENAIPHIFAKSAEDAYFALGFAHAQDRLWQMETMRRAGAGRLSEIMGKATLPIDKFSRHLGFYRTAEARAERMPPDLKQQMDAYAAGVNHYIKHHDGPLSPEFVLLNHEPEPWRASDSLVWSRMMAFRLSQNWWKELFRLRLRGTFSNAQIDELWPSGKGSPVTLPLAKQAAAVLDAVPEIFQPKSASNAWVFSGTRTASGKPILANDPHLGFDAPGLWYLARIKTPDFEVTGATAPGVPITILGHNGTIAWGLTTTGGDTQDLFIETIDPENKDRYLTPDGPRAFALRTELIKVKDGETFSLNIRSTRNGPVMSDISSSAKKLNLTKTVLALKSPGFRADDKSHEALYRINRAQNWSQFLGAARLLHTPQQNIFYADILGNTGMIAPARIPIRNGWEGRWPTDGQNPARVWNGFVPFEALPRAHNPGRGFIGNANNQLVPDSYPYLITKDWEASFRAERLSELEFRGGQHRMKDSEKWQIDGVSAAARKLLPLMLKNQPTQIGPILRRLSLWDYDMSRKKPEPLIYNAWVRALMKELMTPYGQGDLGPIPDFLISVLRDKQAWCDDPRTKKNEKCDDRVSASLNQALEQLSEQYGPNMDDWQWGRAHRAIFKHRLFDHVPIIRHWANLEIATDGGDHTLNRGQTAFGNTSERPYQHRHGAGYRAIYDLSNLDASRFMIATGQSGNIFSQFYGNLLVSWRDGGYIPIAGKQEQLKMRAIGALRLVPAPKAPRTPSRTPSGAPKERS
jgi:penicillin amidase